MDAKEFELKLQKELQGETPLTIEQIMKIAVPIWETLGMTEEEYFARLMQTKKEIEDQKQDAVELSDREDMQGK